MTFSAQVNDAAAPLVLVGDPVLAMILLPHRATELESSPIEIETQTDVEGDVRVVCVHVEAQVLVLAVAHDEAVVTIPIAACTWEENSPDGLKNCLELVHEVLESDVVQDDSIIVHGVRTPGWESGSVEGEDFLQEEVAESFGEDGHRVHLSGLLLTQNFLPALCASLLMCCPERWIEPLGSEGGHRIEELGVLCLLRVLIDD
mmetsp:Transcript_23572/g.35585  ORF Transcript_23572/g.35585 Transcript_23572/m.35585 type:complete len:203 (+) Transcript_23572:834-1442(+)